MKLLIMILTILSLGMAADRKIGEAEVTTSVQVRLILPTTRDSKTNFQFNTEVTVKNHGTRVTRMYDL